MAKYRITGPDGATFEITAPDSATPEQVKAFAQSQFQQAPQGDAKAGGVGAGVKMGLRDPIDAGAQILRRMVPDAVGNAVDSAGNYLASKGLMAPSSGVEGVDKIVQDVNTSYEANRSAAGRDGVDWARVTGNVVNPVNAALPSAAGARTVGQLAKVGAKVGAVSGALQPVVEPGDFWTQKAKQTAAGAAGGAAFTPVLAKAVEGAAKVIPRVLDGLRPAAQTVTAGVSRADMDGYVQRVLNAQGMNIQEAPGVIVDSVKRQIAEALSAGRPVDPAVAVRVARAEALGLTGERGLTAGQATRAPIQYAQERNLSGVAIKGPNGLGNPLADRFQAQNQALMGLFDNAGAAGATDRTTAGQTILSALSEANQVGQGNVRAAYGAYRNAAGKDLEIPLQGLAQDYAQTLQDFGDHIPGAIRQQFEALGLMGGTQRRLLTLDDAERLIKVINKNYDPMNRPQKLALDELRAAVQRATTTAADLAESGAGAEAAHLASEARQTAAQVFQAQREAPALAAAATDAAPDRFVQQYLLNAPVREVEAMRTLVQTNPQAMAAARSQIADHLKRAAFGENAAGDKVFSPERYAAALRALGPQRLGVFFSPQELVRFNLAAQVAADINSVPAGAKNAVNYSNTGSAVLNLLQKLSDAPMLRNIPGARALANQAGEITTEASINQALRGAPAPTPRADLSPETIRALQRLFAPAAVGAGALAGSGVQ